MSTANDKYVKWDESAVEYGQGEEEDSLIHEIEKQINTCQTAVWESTRHAFSGTHVKSHCFLKGEFEVLPNLPAHLAQGLFSHPAQYPAAMRLSTETTAMIDDRVRQPRGLGLKLFNVEGDKLRPDGKDPKTQDFEFNSAPAIELGNARTCRDIIGLRLKHGGCPADLDAALKKRDDYEVQNARNTIPCVNVLGHRQYSQSSFRYGDYVAKFALVPSTSTVGQEEREKELTPSDGENAFKDLVQDHFASSGAEWDFQVQLLERTWFKEKPAAVEDSRIDWPQDRFPYMTVAKLRMPKQETMLAARRVFWEDHIRVDPWHGLVVHKPLGSINRVRKGVYKASSAYRRKLNATREVTVTSIDDIPDEFSPPDDSVRAP
ncbi:unnamed protein product [Parajaminaea phylloscopi]